MDFYAPLKDFVLWIKSLWKKRQFNKQKKLNNTTFNSEDILVALLNKAYKDGNMFMGLSSLEIFNHIPKEKAKNITMEDIYGSIKQHLVKGNIKSATLDADCNYILTDAGRDAAEKYSKSISLT